MRGNRLAAVAGAAILVAMAVLLLVGSYRMLTASSTTIGNEYWKVYKQIQPGNGGPDWMKAYKCYADWSPDLYIGMHVIAAGSTAEEVEESLLQGLKYYSIRGATLVKEDEDYYYFLLDREFVIHDEPDDSSNGEGTDDSSNGGDTVIVDQTDEDNRRKVIVVSLLTITAVALVVAAVKVVKR